MAGLLDFLNTPQGLGLLSGLGGYAAGARRGTPVNNVGRGLVTGLAGYATANDQIKKDSENALTQQYKKMQMDQIQRTLDQQKAQDAWKAGLPAVMAPKLTGTTDQGQQLADQQAAFGPEGVQSLADSSQYAGQNAPLGMNYGTDKQAVQDYLMQPASPYADKIIENKFVPKDPQYKTVGDNLVKIGSDGVANPVFTAPAKPLTPSGDFATFTLLKQQGQLPENTDYTTWHRGNSKAGAAVTNAITNVNAYEPFKNKIQGEMGSSLVKSYENLQSVPQTLQALDSAKAYAAQAHNFSGSMGEDKLAIAKFFNNNLGTNIDPEGVKSAEALKSALFYNVMDNLKKMDASPSQQQQQKMAEAFGNIGTDPNALPWIIDFYKQQITSKAVEHNRRVDQTMSGPAGMQFPYDIHVHVPDATPTKPKPAQAFTLPPNASMYSGKTMRDTQTGKRYMSVGGKWQEVK